MKWPQALTRKYVYRVIIAVLSILIGYGVITADHALLWGDLAAALTLVMAERNVPDGSEMEE